MFITSKNAIVEAASKNALELVYAVNPLGARDKEIVKQLEHLNILVKYVDKKRMFAITEKNCSIVAKMTGVSKIGIESVLDQIQIDTPLIFMLDGITDVHNLGAIIRNAYYFSASAIIIPKDNSAQVNEKVYEVSAGAAYHLPIISSTNLVRSVEYLQTCGFWVYYASEKGEIALNDFKFETKTAVILGNEHSGVRELLKKKADGSICIKSKSKFDSLNVSSACAVISYAYSLSLD